MSPKVAVRTLFGVGKPSRSLAIAESIAATVIWASSFIFIKIGLEHMGPLTITGLRYFLAALLFLPFMTRQWHMVRSLPLAVWVRFSLMGFSAYVLGNGAVNVGLLYLPATTASFLLSFMPLLILLVSIFWLKETPTRVQLLGLLVTLAGSGLFFASGLEAGELIGLALVVFGIFGFVVFGILGREVARDQMANTRTLTAVPLALGGGFLLLIALPVEGLPTSTPVGWVIVWCLAIVNTAIAYILYNHSLQVLTALEANAIGNLLPLVTAILAWLILSEQLYASQIIGLLVVIAGVTLVQWRRGM